MKALVVLVALSGSVVAAPVRKAASDKFTRAAGEAFKRAVEFEDKGNLTQAIAMYRTSLQLMMHPNTVYNLAALDESSGQIAEAIAHYEMYLVLAPNAADAKAVRAKINELAKRPATLTVLIREGIDPKDAYVILDGAIIKKPGELVRRGDKKLTFDVSVAGGKHSLELFTVLGSGMEDVTVTPGQKVTKELFDTGMTGGNIAVMAEYPFSMGKAYDGHGRFTAPAGKQLMKLEFGERECPPVTVDIPSNDDVAYVYIKPLEPDVSLGSSAWHCRKHEIIQRRLKF